VVVLTDLGRIATAAYDGHLIYNWASNPFIRGSYSYARQPGARRELAKVRSDRSIGTRGSDMVAAADTACAVRGRGNG
jgi:hypothetical protein